MANNTLRNIGDEIKLTKNLGLEAFKKYFKMYMSYLGVEYKDIFTYHHCAFNILGFSFKKIKPIRIIRRNFRIIYNSADLDDYGHFVIYLTHDYKDLLYLKLVRKSGRRVVLKLKDEKEIKKFLLEGSLNKNDN